MQPFHNIFQNTSSSHYKDADSQAYIVENSFDHLWQHSSANESPERAHHSIFGPVPVIIPHNSRSVTPFSLIRAFLIWWAGGHCALVSWRWLTKAHLCITFIKYLGLQISLARRVWLSPIVVSFWRQLHTFANGRTIFLMHIVLSCCYKAYFNLIINF